VCGTTARDKHGFDDGIREGSQEAPAVGLGGEGGC
jgi:hypothetical protein